VNVGGIPFVQHDSGFWLIVILVAGFTGAVGVWAFRRRPQ